MDKVGTSYFITFERACRYYHDYDPALSHDELCRWVARKIVDGEIHIGEPPLKPGQYRELIKDEGRYAIVTP